MSVWMHSLMFGTGFQSFSSFLTAREESGVRWRFSSSMRVRRGDSDAVYWQNGAVRYRHSSIAKSCSSTSKNNAAFQSTWKWGKPSEVIDIARLFSHWHQMLRVEYQQTCLMSRWNYLKIPGIIFSSLALTPLEEVAKLLEVIMSLHSTDCCVDLTFIFKDTQSMHLLAES